PDRVFCFGRNTNLERQVCILRLSQSEEGARYRVRNDQGGRRRDLCHEIRNDERGRAVPPAAVRKSQAHDLENVPVSWKDTHETEKKNHEPHENIEPIERADDDGPFGWIIVDREAPSVAEGDRR